MVVSGIGDDILLIRSPLVIQSGGGRDVYIRSASSDQIRLKLGEQLGSEVLPGIPFSVCPEQM